MRLGLLLQEVGRLNNIQVADQEIQQAIFRQASQYPGQEHRIAEFYRSNPRALASVQAPLFEDKIVDFILELATVTEREVSAKELFADAEAAEEAAA